MTKYKKSKIISEEKKRIAYLSAAPRVSTRPNTGESGPRSHILGVIQALESLDWEVHPFIVGDRISKVLVEDSQNRMQQSSLIRFVADIARIILGIVHSIQAWLELHNKVDLVYERYAVLQALGWIFQKENTPWILETNGLYFYEAAVERKSIVLTGLARKIEIWAYRQCDVLVCITEELKNLIIKETRISPEKILVIPNGVDITYFDPQKHDANRLFSGPTIGFVGALLNWHRLDILIESLNDLKSEGINYNFVVVGEGPMRRIWENRVRELGMEETIRFIGQIPWEMVPSYIAGFDLGFLGNNILDIGTMYHSPLKLYEYMAMALPVIASAYADAKNMIIQGQNGYIFQPGDVEDLKKVLRLAYQNKEDWKKMGVLARKKVIDCASWPARVQTMVSGIEQILLK